MSRSTLWVCAALRCSNSGMSEMEGRSSMIGYAHLIARIARARRSPFAFPECAKQKFNVSGKKRDKYSEPAADLIRVGHIFGPETLDKIRLLALDHSLLE